MTIKRKNRQAEIVITYISEAFWTTSTINILKLEISPGDDMFDQQRGIIFSSVYIHMLSLPLDYRFEMVT